MDSVEANRRWAEKVGGIGYPLLSDFSPLGSVSLKYDCFMPKQGYGKRAMFLIDKSGRLQHVELLDGYRAACPDLRSVMGAVRKLDEQERRVD
jgi:peroxiredoxin